MLSGWVHTRGLPPREKTFFRMFKKRFPRRTFLLPRGVPQMSLYTGIQRVCASAVRMTGCRGRSRHVCYWLDSRVRVLEHARRILENAGLGQDKS